MRISINVLVTVLALSTLAGCATESAATRATRQGDTAVRAETRRISEASRLTVNEAPATPHRAQRVTTF
jgi:hypothetical protein